MVRQVVRAPVGDGGVYTFAPVDKLDQVHNVYQDTLKAVIALVTPTAPAELLPSPAPLTPDEELSSDSDSEVWVLVMRPSQCATQDAVSLPAPIMATGPARFDSIVSPEDAIAVGPASSASPAMQVTAGTIQMLIISHSLSTAPTRHQTESWSRHLMLRLPSLGL